MLERSQSDADLVIGSRYVSGGGTLGWQPGRLLSGEGDIDISLVFGGAGVRGASAEVDLANVVLDGGEAFEIAGRLEFDRSPEGWLVAAEEFLLAFSRETRELYPSSAAKAKPPGLKR